MSIIHNESFEKGKQEERERILKMILGIKFKYHTHKTANFSDTFLCGLDEGLDELRQQINTEEETAK